MKKLSIALVSLMLAGPCSARDVGSAIEPMAAFSATDSLLVIAPHPDDESLCCAGAISLARRVGAQVTVVWVTDGDGSRINAMIAGKTLRPRVSAYRELGQRRAEEARHAARMLGIPPESQFFLGYPDTGILSMTSRFYATPWRSPRTGFSSVSQEGALTPGRAYEGQNLAADLSQLIERMAPTLVLAPSPRDAHRDHRGVGLITARVLAAHRMSNRGYYWIVHGGAGWPAPRVAQPFLPQNVPPRGRGLAWQFVSLDPVAIDDKRRALDAHASPRRIMARTMNSFVRATELFTPFVGEKEGDQCSVAACRPAPLWAPADDFL